MSDQTFTPVSAKEARLQLLGSICKACGGNKAPGMSHCRSCFFTLPRTMQRPLYRRLGHGYEAAYNESLRYLSEHVRVRKAASDENPEDRNTQRRRNVQENETGASGETPVQDLISQGVT